MFDPNKVLPPEQSIDSIDDILYSIGLCHQSVRECPKRSRLYSPSLIAGITLFQMTLRLLSFLDDSEIQTYKKAVDGRDACMILANIVGQMVLWKTLSKNLHHDTLNALSGWNQIGNDQAI